MNNNTFPITYNVHGAGGLNPTQRQRLKDHLKKTRPAWVVVMGDKSLGQEILSETGAQIIFRQKPFAGYPDEDVWKHLTPKQWVEHAQKTSLPEFWNYTNNESGNSPELLKWLTDLIDESRAAGMKLVLGNFNTGTPHETEYHLLINLLRKIAAEPNRLRLGLHEYAGAVGTSGLVGGAPDDPRHANYLIRANWPESTEGLVLWHVGRFRFIYDVCKNNGIPLIPIVITEGGFDHTKDIDSWLNTLPRTHPYNDINHWKSCQRIWANWFPDWSHERAYIEQLKWIYRAILKGSTVQAYALFSFGDSGGWDGYNLADAGEFQSLLEQWAAEWYQAGTNPPPPIEEPPPPSIPPANPVVMSIVWHNGLDTDTLNEMGILLGAGFIAFASGGNSQSGYVLFFK